MGLQIIVCVLWIKLIIVYRLAYKVLFLEVRHASVYSNLYLFVYTFLRNKICQDAILIAVCLSNEDLAYIVFLRHANKYKSYKDKV